MSLAVSFPINHLLPVRRPCEIWSVLLINARETLLAKFEIYTLNLTEVKWETMRCWSRCRKQIVTNMAEAESSVQNKGLNCGRERLRHKISIWNLTLGNNQSKLYHLYFLHYFLKYFFHQNFGSLHWESSRALAVTLKVQGVGLSKKSPCQTLVFTRTVVAKVSPLPFISITQNFVLPLQDLECELNMNHKICPLALR